MSKLNAKRSEYNTQRTCGVWLIYIGFIIVLSALVGNDLVSKW